MLINSRINESGTTIHNVQVDNAFSETGFIQQRSVQYDMGEYGQAHCTQLSTSGLAILEVQFAIEQQITDTFVVEDEHLLMSLFFQGHSEVVGIDGLPSFKLDGGLMRVNFQPATQFEFDMQPNEAVRYVAILMSRDFFLGLLQHETWTGHDKLVDAVRNRNYFQFNEGASLINYQVLDIIHQLFDISHPSASEPFRKTFIYMKLREMLFLFHLQHYTDTRPVLHEIDTETTAALQKARAILTMNIAQPPTIRQLSRDVMLNEQKLKQGFKQLFDTTIYAYVVQLRMDEASRLILNPDYSINQISARLGYNSTSHFIAAFKKQFGSTPKQAALQKARLNRTSDS